MNDPHTGTGRMQPLDADVAMEITLRERDGEIVSADYTCSGGEAARRCAETVCRVIIGHGVTELFQMNNNAVYYNIEPELGIHELFNASVAVMAAKRAAADWCKKNGVMIPAEADCCGCISE